MRGSAAGTLPFQAPENPAGRFRIKRIQCPLLAVRSLKLEVVSDTHELNSITAQFPLEPAPIVTGLHIVIFIIDGTDNVNSGEPPFRMILIPNGTDLAVIVEAYGFLSQNQVSFIAIYEKSGSNASLLRPHAVAGAGQEENYGSFEFH